MNASAVAPCCREEELLRAVLARYGAPLAIALSGGIDSRLLVYAALRAGCDVAAVNAGGPHIAPAETLYAEDFARRMNLPLFRPELNLLGLDGVSDNSKRRCYFCKKALIEKIKEELAAAGGPERVICDGSNADDLQAYRPGMAALKEAGVRSPLAEAGLGKAAIRRIAALSGLENPGQASRPCLLTRLAYGLKPEAEVLRKIAMAEAALEEALKIDEFRLRLTPAPVLQCPPLSESQKALALKILSAYGFADCAVLEGGLVSGFFDRSG